MKQSSDYPLVSVGMPTYNRASSLKRAINSVLDQDYPNIEIVISDNASNDDTEKICREYVEKNNKVRYFRQNYNLGALANFVEVLKISNGEYFMWLGDDDYLDLNYISTCLNEMVKNPDYYLVSGTAKYFDNGKFIKYGVKTNIINDKNIDRLISYYEIVTRNGVFYGLYRRKEILGLKLLNVVGSDWLFVAQVTFLGKIITLNNTYINRNFNFKPKRTYLYFKDRAKSLGLPLLQVKYQHYFIAFYNFIVILFRSDIYKELNFIPRFVLAFQSSKLIIERFTSYRLIKKYFKKLT